MNTHIDIKTLSDYFLNRLGGEDETAVQEHLSSCPECRKKLEAMRRLRKGVFTDGSKHRRHDTITFRILRYGWAKAAAAAIIICGIGFTAYEVSVNRNDGTVQDCIQNARSIENEIFAIDTFDTEDSVYYKDKYGEDFFKKDRF